MRVRLGVFSPSVLLGVAAVTGALARAGLELEEVAVRSSSHQFALLAAGEIDAALTSPDNVLAYRGSPANPLGRTLDVRVLAALDRGLGLSLFAAPGADPRGGVLAVDVPTSGFAFVAYELMARRGLRRGRDYEVLALGATPRRADALIAGRCAATVLNAGGDLRAEAAGCARLVRASALGPYVGTVLAASGERLDGPGGAPALGALTDVLLATARTLAGGGSRQVALAVTGRRLGLTGDAAARHLATLADPREGLIPDGRLDAASLETLRALRARHGGASGEVPPPSDPGLVDGRYLTPLAP